MYRVDLLSVVIAVAVRIDLSSEPHSPTPFAPGRHPLRDKFLLSTYAAGYGARRGIHHAVVSQVEMGRHGEFCFIGS